MRVPIQHKIRICFGETIELAAMRMHVSPRGSHGVEWTISRVLPPSCKSSVRLLREPGDQRVVKPRPLASPYAGG